MDPTSVALVLIGLVTGGSIVWLLGTRKMSVERIRTEERIRAQGISESKLKAEIQNLAVEIGRKNSEDFLRVAAERLGKVQTSAERDMEARTKAVEDLIAPIREELKNLEKATSDMEISREGAYQGLKRTIEILH